MNRSPRLPTALRRASRGAVTVTRLHRGGDEPVRVLMVADRGVTAVPHGGADPHFADVVVDRLWLRVRRGLDVDVVQEPWAALHAIAGSLASWRPPRYDLVVVAIDPAGPLGVHEQHGLNRILHSVVMRLVQTTRVVLIALEPGAGSPRHRVTTALGPELLQAARSPLVRLTILRIAAGGAGTADDVAHHLQLAIALIAAPVDEGADALLADLPATAAALLSRRLAQIAQIARSSFSLDTAAVTVAENGVLTTIACDGGALGVASQAGSLCDLTLGHDSLVVIADTWTVPRGMVDREVRASGPVRFYAGQPISAPGRVGFGVLCLYDRMPHHRSEFDFTILQDLAMLVEGELAEARG